MTKPTNAAGAAKLLQNIYARKSTHQQDAFNLMDYINDPAFVRVPVEPTDAMVDIDTSVMGNDHYSGNVEISEPRLRELWHEMITASKEKNCDRD